MGSSHSFSGTRSAHHRRRGLRHSLPSPPPIARRRVGSPAPATAARSSSPPQSARARRRSPPLLPPGARCRVGARASAARSSSPPLSGSRRGPHQFTRSHAGARLCVGAPSRRCPRPVVAATYARVRACVVAASELQSEFAAAELATCSGPAARRSVATHRSANSPEARSCCVLELPCLLAVAAWKERVKGERKGSLELITDGHEDSMHCIL